MSFISNSLSNIFPRGASAGPSGPNADFAASIEGLSPQAARLGKIADRRTGRVERQAGQQMQELRGAASSALAQQDAVVPTSFAGSLDAAARRSKARAGIISRGDSAIRNQQLRDRLEIARRSRGRQGQALRGLGAAANIQEGVNLGVQDARDFGRQSQADLFGGLAGIAAGIAAPHIKTALTPLKEIDLSTLPGRRGP